MMGRFRSFLMWSVVISMASALPGALCWGKEGHYATCKIAETLLSKAAADAVQQLLPDYAEGDLASLCSWPDQIKFLHKYHWSSPLHYIDTPDFRCNYDYPRDCHNAQGERDVCVAGAINNYTSQLTTYGTLSAVKYLCGRKSTVQIFLWDEALGPTAAVLEHRHSAVKLMAQEDIQMCCFRRDYGGGKACLQCGEWDEWHFLDMEIRKVVAGGYFLHLHFFELSA